MQCSVLLCGVVLCGVVWCCVVGCVVVWCGYAVGVDLTLSKEDFAQIHHLS